MNLKLSKKEKRIIIILMTINLFAFFVNHFRLSPSFDIGEYPKTDEMFLFTDAKESEMLNDNGHSIGYDLYDTRSSEHFYPFTEFIEKERPSFTNSEDYYLKTRYRGFFPDYDKSEFFVYSLLIFAVVIVRKIW
jgi:hypothetical protein